MIRVSRKSAARDAAPVLTVDGIDVSLYQGTIDWQQVVTKKTQQGQQIGFAYIKATDGGSIVDPQFGANWRNSKGLLPRGAYHFFRATSAPEGARPQAENFIRTLKAALAATGEESLELPPVVDVEWDSIRETVTAEQIIAGLQIFLAPVEQAFGARAIIYTGAAFWRSYMKDSQAFSRDHLLWIAVYGARHADDDGSDPPARRPRAPGGWATFSIWQNAVQKGVPGIQGLVDRDQIVLPAGTTVIDFLNGLHGRPPLPGDDLKIALLERAGAQDCMRLDHDSQLFKQIVADGFGPNSPEFSIEFQEAGYQAQRAERVDRDGVRVYYIKAAPGEAVHYVIRTDGSTQSTGGTPNSLRDALIAAAEAKLSLPFNKNAGIQRRMYADGYLPISAEFSWQFGGANYAAQCAEHPATGQMRVYYARDPDWDKVQFITRT